MNARIVYGLLMLSVVLGVVGGMHWYLWLRLVRDPELPALWGRVATVALVAMALSIPASFFFARALPRSVGIFVSGAVYVWMGLSFYLLLGALGVDAARLVARAAGAALRHAHAATAAVADDGRRLFLARLGAGVVGALGLASASAALVVGLRAPRVRTVRVALKKLPASLSGLTIVQLTDVHVGPTIGKGFIEDLVRRTNALQPDVVAITGDLVDGSVAALGAFVEPLRNLRARHGVFFVTGNHEYYSGVGEWLPFLEGLGIRVLRNERVALGDGDAGLDLAGVDDWSSRGFGEGHGADLAKALAGHDAAREVVLLAHQPKAITEAAERGVGLVLSGHTHGGQLWPWTYLVRLDQPYLAGLHKHGETQIYVSEGTGYWGPPMRLGTHGEITKLVLERA